MVCVGFDVSLTQTFQTHPGTNIIYIFPVSRNAIQMIQSENHNIRTSVLSEILAYLLCLCQDVCPHSKSESFFCFFNVIYIVSTINLI